MIAASTLSFTRAVEGSGLEGCGVASVPGEVGRVVAITFDGVTLLGATLLGVTFVGVVLVGAISVGIVVVVVSAEVSSGERSRLNSQLTYKDSAANTVVMAKINPTIAFLFFSILFGETLLIIYRKLLRK